MRQTKHRAIAALLVFLTLTPGPLLAQEEDNVLSYYAVGNSLDGQPLIEARNVLRFFPTFVTREQMDSVRVTVYYGPHIFTRLADRRDGGMYWEVLLPSFELGDAIQRIEVEAIMNIGRQAAPERIASIRLLRSIGDAVRRLDSAFSPLALRERLARAIDSATTSYGLAAQENLRQSLQFVAPAQEYRDALGNMRRSTERALDSITRSATDSARLAQAAQLIVGIRGMLDSALDRRIGLSDSVLGLRIDTLVTRALRSVPELPSVTNLIDSAITQTIAATTANLESLGGLRDSLRRRFIEENLSRLADTAVAGPSIQLSDVILDSNLTRTRILYRNYKASLRSMRALDPAEQLGIFRARYVPFVVAGGTFRPTFVEGNDNEAVFEVGLAFSDVAVPGDDFVRPMLSINRLGFAFAITRHLFSDSAKVRALALTYDFNAYGSIAVGANFPGSVIESYFSFGINKRAFEDVLVSIAGLF
jgi:hypothetical protein